MDKHTQNVPKSEIAFAKISSRHVHYAMNNLIHANSRSVMSEEIWTAWNKGETEFRRMARRRNKLISKRDREGITIDEEVDLMTLDANIERLATAQAQWLRMIKDHELANIHVRRYDGFLLR